MATEVIPKNIKEAFAELDSMLQQEDKEYILRNGPIVVHHSLGHWIRNNWGLWGEDANELKNIFIETGINHPDDMSNYIIKWYIHHLKADDDFYKKELNIIKKRHERFN